MKEKGLPRNLIVREDILTAEEVLLEDQYCDGYVYAVLVKDLDGRWWSRLLPDASWSGAALELANLRTRSRNLAVRVIRIKEEVVDAQLPDVSPTPQHSE